MKDSREEINKVIESAIAEELAAANKNFPYFASWHEGYAVLLEEVEEAVEAMELLKEDDMEYLWRSIRMKNVDDEIRYANVEGIRNLAVAGILELIQVAAMCDKIKYSMETRNCEPCGPCDSVEEAGV